MRRKTAALFCGQKGDEEMNKEENCAHDCSNCGEECESRKIDFSVAPNPLSTVDKVIGVVSGKGGVGKSLVTSLLASVLQRRGNQCAVLDADITGPSIPKMFGVSKMAQADVNGILPNATRSGIEIMSINLLTDDPSAPVIWRGPAIADVVKQFWSSVVWSGIDYMFVDMPPGTGDVPLTVFQSLPVDGIIIVSSPQELVSMIVEKAVRMAEQMNIPILGIVENMSSVICPDCGKEIKIFGESKVEETAAKHGFEMLAKIPVDPRITALCDAGDIEKYPGKYLDHAADVIEHMEKREKK
jgi:Mrp family chromosome partitioning ATPase